MKKKAIYSLIIGIFLTLIISLGAYYFISSSSQETVGSSVLGLEQVNFFTSSSDCFSSEGDNQATSLWLYTLRGGGLSQWAHGYVTPDDVNNIYDGEQLPEENLVIDTFYDQYCTYPIVKNDFAMPIYKLTDPIEWTCVTFLDSSAAERCGADWAYGGKYGGQLTCWCVDRQQKTGAVGSAPNFNNPGTKTDMTIQVKSQGETYSTTLSSNAQVKGKVGNNVCAIWQGNTVTGQVCGLPSEDAVPAYINGEWKLLSNDYYESYKIKWNDVLVVLVQGGSSQSEIANSIDSLNYRADMALNSRVQFGSITEPTVLSGSKIEKKLTTLIQYPILTMYVKANWLGIVTPIPDPLITSLSSECFGAGENGKIQVNIRNYGERGDIDVYGTCTNGFAVERTSVSLASAGDNGDRKTVYLDLTGSTNQVELKGTCTIYADSIEHTDSRNVEVCVKGQITCEVGHEWCEDGNVWNCPTGISTILKDNCISQGLVCEYGDNGNPFCASSTSYCEEHPEDSQCSSGGSGCGCWIGMPFGSGCLLPDLWCHLNNLVYSFRVGFAILLGFLGGLVFSSFIVRFLKNNKHKVRWWVIGICFIVIGGILGYLAFIYFWIILLLIIILGLIKWLVPGI